MSANLHSAGAFGVADILLPAWDVWNLSVADCNCPDLSVGVEQKPCCRRAMWLTILQQVCHCAVACRAVRANIYGLVS